MEFRWNSMKGPLSFSTQDCIKKVVAPQWKRTKLIDSGTYLTFIVLFCSLEKHPAKASELNSFDGASKNRISNPTKTWCTAEEMSIVVKCRWEWKSNLIAQCTTKQKKTMMLLQANEGEKAITAPFYFETRLFKTIHETLHSKNVKLLMWI